MAKTNQVDLCGICTGYPKVGEKKEKAVFMMYVARGNRDTGSGDKQIKWESPIIRTKDPDIVEVIHDLKPYDLVRIKGVIVTKSVQMGTICDHCSNEHTYMGTITYIEPIYIEKLQSFTDIDAAKSAVIDRVEVSNEIRIIGDLCTEPEKIPFKSGKSCCQYQIAVPRTYRLKQSIDDDKTDFPFVKSYGKNAKEDLKRLHIGSQILIDGCLQSRIREKEVKCPKCNFEYKVQESLLDIVPYETEYLRNYVTDEDLGIIKVVTDSE